ncbi:hypothetical protein DE146DRAFT_631750 [Phaeosphaeria sp. MPI-PUGE-AT-0046c]|nr:hypothetical protein DE146DRAFT_631750 [Phaeosphaeria sp. MPI-PUGE-AT-0046c]
MFSTLLYLATLLQVANGLAIPDASTPHTNHLQKRLQTGGKVALGICIPGAVLVFGLGLVVVVFYPSQLKKLRRENAEAQLALDELRNGKVQHAPPPPYVAGENNSGDADRTGSDAPAYETTPTAPAAPRPVVHAVTPAEARHAALMG